MKPIKQALSKYKSTYAAAEANEAHAKQLDRLKDKGALVDDDGQVWIKSKTVLPDCKEECTGSLKEYPMKPVEEYIKPYQFTKTKDKE